MNGHKFGRWTVIGAGIKPDGYTGHGPFWQCRCDCGTVRSVWSQSVKYGQSKSCGCLQREVAGAQIVRVNTRHGEARNGRRTKEWSAWRNMISRCTYPSVDHYHLYGGRGITVCARWRKSFEDFLADVGRAQSKRHSIDRIDNDGHYEPGNVRWARDNSQQQRNSRHIRHLTLNGVTKPLCDWATALGISRTVITQRIDSYRWTVERALTTPVQARK